MSELLRDSVLEARIYQCWAHGGHREYGYGEKYRCVVCGTTKRERNAVRNRMRVARSAYRRLQQQSLGTSSDDASGPNTDGDAAV